MPRALLTPDEIRAHQFVKIGWNCRTSFVIRCTAKGCDFESPTLYDAIDMANWKRRHLDGLELAKGARVEAERARKRAEWDRNKESRNTRRRKNKKTHSDRQGDGRFRSRSDGDGQETGSRQA